MSAIDKKPFIIKALETLSVSDLETLKNLVNGGVSNELSGGNFRSLINPEHYITENDTGIHEITLEISRNRAQNLYKGYLVYNIIDENEYYCFLIYYSTPDQQTIGIVKVELNNPHSTYLFCNPLTILELRSEVNDVLMAKGGSSGSVTGGGTLWYQHLFTLRGAYQGNDVRICLTMSQDASSRFISFTNSAFSTNYTTVAECITAINQAISAQLITIGNITAVIGLLSYISDNPLNCISTMCIHDVDPTYWYQLLNTDSDGIVTLVAGSAANSSGYVLQQKYQLDLPSSVDLVVTPLDNSGSGGGSDDRLPTPTSSDAGKEIYATEDGKYALADVFHFIVADFENINVYFINSPDFETQAITAINTMIDNTNSQYSTTIPNISAFNEIYGLFAYIKSNAPTAIFKSFYATLFAYLSTISVKIIYYSMSPVNGQVSLINANIVDGMMVVEDMVFWYQSYNTTTEQLELHKSIPLTTDGLAEVDYNGIRSSLS